MIALPVGSPRLLMRARDQIEQALARAGVSLNGPRPYDIQVLDEAFFEAVATGGLTGAREAYVNGYWETDALDEVAFRLLRADITLTWAGRAAATVETLRAAVLNLQDVRGARRGVRHYEVGDELFENMLDRRMIYSCAYWDSASTLDEAQEAKLDLVCRKVGLRPGMRVLDIGCGWGGLARFAAERYQVSVVGITISDSQAKWAREVCKGLPVEIRVQDYRQLRAERGRFDAVVSIGMLEHVGHKNYRAYMEVVRRVLKTDGLFLLHTIGSNTSRTSYDVWMNENIFPAAMLPSTAQIGRASEGLFVMEDWHNIGTHYDRTLREWFANFERAWPRLRARFGDRFYRIWKCYLLTCAGAFRAREYNLWQMVFSPKGTVGGYASLR
jgi:cyclopropane-fatty-acyl-phospholipid synthase